MREIIHSNKMYNRVQALLHKSISDLEEDSKVGKIMELAQELDQYKTELEKQNMELNKDAQLLKIVNGLKQFAIILLNQEGNIISSNAGAQHIFGYSEEEILNRHFSILYFEEDINKEKPSLALKQAITKSKFIIDGRLRDKDGNSICTNITITPTSDSFGELFGYVMVTQDITERKELEVEAKKYTAEIAHNARLSSMGEMATNLAHELNQPLSAVLIYAESNIDLLSSGSISIDECIEAFTEIKNEAKHGTEIIRRIRSFMRNKTETTKIKINELVFETLKFIKPEVYKKNIIIRKYLLRNLPIVIGDKIQLMQVFINILHNSIEACDDKDKSYEICIHTFLNSDDQIQITITDTGSGIEADLGAHIFEPYYTTKSNGLGMGLAICRTIIDNHMGEIWFDADPNTGASFHITLPKVKDILRADEILRG